MKKLLAFGVPVVAVTMAFAVGPAFAGESVGNNGRMTLRPTGMLLADNVVVTPGAPSAPAPAPAAAPQAPAPAAPAQQTAVVETAPRTNKTVHTEVQPNRNYMSTIAVSALMGGLLGVLVGGSVYYLGDQDNAREIAYWAAGGVLLGTGVGVVQVMVQEGRASNATALHKLPSDPAPTLRLALFRATF